MQDKLLLMVAYHKNHRTLESVKKIYNPIQVSRKAMNAPNLGILADDDAADNISDKNDYSELTAHYYAWKNTDYDYYGLMHYRRYLVENRIKQKYRHILYRLNLNPKFRFDKLKILKILSEYDLILPKKRKIKYGNIYQEYGKIDHCENLDLAKKIIKEKYASYLENFNNVMEMKKCYWWNIFISNKDFFNEYSQWLFDILFEVEKRIADEGYYRTRIFGYLSEVLFNVFIHHQIIKNHIKIKELPVVRLRKY